MKRLLGRSAPIGVQVALLVLISVAAVQAVNAAILLLAPRPERAVHSPERVARLLTGAERSDDFTISQRPEPPADDYVDADERGFTSALAAALGESAARVRAVFMAHPDGPGLIGQAPPRARPLDGAAPEAGFIAARRQADGSWRWLEEKRGWLDAWQRRALLWLLLSVLVIAPIGLLFARRFIRPIRAFAAGAERIGENPRGPPLVVQGPAEIEEAAVAFGRMQRRIALYVEERTAMVGAIAHDLRTPLTRLAFRLEGLGEAQREAAMADIEEMQAMIAQALDFVRGEGRPVAAEPVDLADLLARAADGLAHEEAPIALAPSPPVMVAGDAGALIRSLSNLLQNAVRYGAAARGQVTASEGRATVTIDDDGPGIPEAELEKVFEPFYRREPSRNRRHAGAGLGLAIARAIALAHGGTLILANREGGGLRATLTLPLLEAERP